MYIFYCLPLRYDPQTNQWSSDVAPTSSCRTSVGVAVLDNSLYAVGGQDGVSCLNFVERFEFHPLMFFKRIHYIDYKYRYIDIYMRLPRDQNDWGCSSPSLAADITKQGHTY